MVGGIFRPFHTLIFYNIPYGPVASKHSNRRSLLYASSMAYLGRTTGQHRHRVGKEGGGNGNRGGGRIRGTGGTETDGIGNGRGMPVGEAGESGEGGGSRENEGGR